MSAPSSAIPSSLGRAASAPKAASTAAQRTAKPAGQRLDPARKRVDQWMLAGLALTFAAVVAGIAATKVPAAYFLQPSGLLIVLGGTLGATIVTTPKHALHSAVRRAWGLWCERGPARAELVDEILSYVRLARTKGIVALEPAVRDSRHEFLRESLALALDVHKPDLQAALGTQIRLQERRGEADARTLEIAGGFAPTIGVLGTVVGLIDALRRFSDLSAVAGGVGTAFASTLYGIGLANLLLLPLAQRIRAAVAADFEIQELILEGVVCILDGVHPALAAERLKAFLDQKKAG